MDKFVFTTEIDGCTRVVYYEVEGDCDGPIYHITGFFDLKDNELPYKNGQYTDEDELKMLASEHHWDLRFYLYTKKGIMI